MSPKIKHFSVITTAGLWFIFAVYFLYFDGLFTGGKPLIFERQSFGTIFGPIIILYLMINHHSKPKGEPKFSFFTMWFGLIGCGAVWLGIDSFLIKKIIPILIAAPIVIAGILHLIIGYWTYQNLSWNLLDEKPGLSQTDLNYEIINFQKVGEVVSQVNDGDWDVLSSGVYKIEVTDAAIQALSEKALKSTVERLQLLSSLPQGKREAHGLQYLKEMIDELDSSSMHQIYPLLADDQKYLAFFYDGDHDLKDFVTGLTNNLNGQLAAKNLEEAYFENMPCATFWPVICVYF